MMCTIPEPQYDDSEYDPSLRGMKLNLRMLVAKDVSERDVVHSANYLLLVGRLLELWSREADESGYVLLFKSTL